MEEAERFEPWTIPNQCPRCGSQEFIERGTMEYKQVITVDENGEMHWGSFENDDDSERDQSYECAICEFNLGLDEGDDDGE